MRVEAFCWIIVILRSISLYSLSSMMVRREGRGFLRLRSCFIDLILLFTFTNQ
jgi:hypothetical protein